jgi:hypothetical protein
VEDEIEELQKDVHAPIIPATTRRPLPLKP